MIALGKLFSLIPGRIWIALGLITLALSALSYEHHQGALGERKKEAERVVKAQAVIAKREVKANTISDDSHERLILALAQIDQLTAKLKAKAPRYVTAKDDAACHVPDGFVSLYNARVSGSETGLPETPGGSEVGSAGGSTAPR